MKLSICLTLLLSSMSAAIASNDCTLYTEAELSAKSHKILNKKGYVVLTSKSKDLAAYKLELHKSAHGVRAFSHWEYHDNQDRNGSYSSGATRVDKLIYTYYAETTLKDNAETTVHAKTRGSFQGWEPTAEVKAIRRLPKCENL